MAETPTNATRQTSSPLTWRIFVLILMTDGLESFAELCLKKVVTATAIDQVTLANLWAFLVAVGSQGTFWLALGCLLLVFVLWITMLAELDLSVAFPLGSGLYVFVPLLAAWALHETIPPLRWLGVLCILVGIVCVSRSSQRSSHA